MSKIKINHLPTDSSSLKELNYWETSSVIGGSGEVSSEALLYSAVQEALDRSDSAQNSRSKN